MKRYGNLNEKVHDFKNLHQAYLEARKNKRYRSDVLEGIDRRCGMKCKFDLAWRGECGKETVKGSEYCEEHLGKKCIICGRQATHECDHASSISCCAPLCDSMICGEKHKHS